MSDKDIVEKIDKLDATLNRAERATAGLADSVARATEAAARLLRCAESISNPVYSVSMQGHHGDLQVQAVRHFQGQICITVANPFNDLQAERPNRLGQGRVIGQDKPASSSKDIIDV